MRGSSSDLGRRERWMPKVQRQAALLSSFSVGWCASASLTFHKNTSGFLFLLALLRLRPSLPPFNCLLLLCCWWVGAGRTHSWSSGPRFHSCALPLPGLTRRRRRPITARNLIRFKTSSAGLKASDMIVLVHKLTQRVLIPPAGAHVNACECERACLRVCVSE